METEEEKRARLENDAATKRLRLAMEMDKERKARLEKMVATTELMLALIGVVNVQGGNSWGAGGATAPQLLANNTFSGF